MSDRLLVDDKEWIARKVSEMIYEPKIEKIEKEVCGQKEKIYKHATRKFDIDSLPEGYISIKSNLHVVCGKKIEHKSYREYEYEETIRFDSDRKVPCRGYLDGKTGLAIYKKYIKLTSTIGDIRKEQYSFQSQLLGKLKVVNTLKQLKEKFPEAYELLPNKPVEFPMIITFDELSKQIKPLMKKEDEKNKTT